MVGTDGSQTETPELCLYAPGKHAVPVYGPFICLKNDRAVGYKQIHPQQKENEACLWQTGSSTVLNFRTGRYQTYRLRSVIKPTLCLAHTQKKRSLDLLNELLKTKKTSGKVESIRQSARLSIKF